MMTLFRSPRIRRIAASATLLFLLPVQALGAVSWLDELGRYPDEPVTRGQFVRAAVDAFDIPSDERAPLPYERAVPRSILPFIGAAWRRGALEVFGKEFLPARPITVGEALQVMVGLQDLAASQTSTSFTDVPAGTPLEAAVNVAVEKDWMKPVRTRQFGVDVVLTGARARLLLRKAIGEDVALTPAQGGTSTTVVRFRTKAPEPLPHQSILQTVWELLSTQYLHEDRLDPDTIAYSIAEAMAAATGDPYTNYLRPASAAEFQTRLGGSVQGIGAEVEYRDDVLIIVTPIVQSPAERAGLQPGDEILAVDGKSLAGMTLIDAVNRVRGPEGTTVKLQVRRNGRIFDVTVTRKKIAIPEIDVRWQGTIAIVHLYQFGERTDRELRAMLQDVNDKHPTGIILDLRNNPGGLLHAAGTVLSNVLPQGSIVARIATRGDEYSTETDDPPTIDSTVKLIVLVNRGSASSSEIVAGALQDYGRATIVGEKTFGKGTVQQVVDFPDGSSLKMTIAEWLTPKGRTIDGVGVTPDITVESATDRDEQLLRAVELLR